MGPSFMRHVEKCSQNGGRIKNDPKALIKPSGISLEQEVHYYLVHKLEAFERGLAQLHELKEERLHLLLQKTLEFPIHLARKLLDLAGADLTDDSKSRVVELYQSLAGEEEWQLFEMLIGADRYYSTQLKRQLEYPNRRTYQGVIKSLKRQPKYALELTKTVIRNLGGVTI